MNNSDNDDGDGDGDVMLMKVITRMMNQILQLKSAVMLWFCRTRFQSRNYVAKFSRNICNLLIVTCTRNASR